MKIRLVAAAAIVAVSASVLLAANSRPVPAEPIPATVPTSLNSPELFNATYIFTKSGSEVRIVEYDTVQLGGATVEGFTVERIDTGKRFFAPYGSLMRTGGEAGGIK